jgi:phage virion morphogenesis protein
VYEIKVDYRELERVQARFQKLAGKVQRPQELLQIVASLLEAQTKRRISDEKRAPDGTPWADWSPEYARTRKPQHSLLIDSQSLLDDIASLVEGGEAIAFASMVYAGAHQDSRRDSLTSRPFLGVSADNADEILDVVEGWITDAIA